MPNALRRTLFLRSDVAWRIPSFMPKRKNISEIACALPRNETLSTKGVEELFDWKPTFLYLQFRQGRIKGYLIPTTPGRRGKRLWDARSIREFIARHEAGPFPVPPNAHRPRKQVAAAQP